MTISKELFLAILSMDAYNRGYGAGIIDPTATGGGLGVSTEDEDYFVGNAKIVDSKGDAEAQAAGFYAIAYDTPYGTVISYRGTDFTPADDFQADRENGWIAGGGNFLASQLQLATEFLDAVQANDAAGSVLLTGHSLGGGLAMPLPVRPRRFRRRGHSRARSAPSAMAARSFFSSASCRAFWCSFRPNMSLT